MQGTANSHLIGILCIIVVISAAFWIFDFDDKLFVKNRAGEAVSNVVSISEPDGLMAALPQSEPTTQNAFQSATGTVTESNTVLKKMESERAATSRLSELESRQFSIDLRGSAFVATTSVSHDAALQITMRPVHGTNIQLFTVNDAKFILSGSAVNLKSPAVEIVGRDLILTFVSDTVGEFAIKGTLDEDILSDTNNRQNVSLQDQLFYLVNKDVPYKLVMSGTLTS